MMLEGANKFNENNEYIIYTMNNSATGQYCTIVPNNIGNEVSMLVDLNMKKLFDSLAENNTTKDELLKIIEEEYNKIKVNYPTSVLIFPMLDMTLLENAINSNDKQKMFDETKKIGSITSELYKKLTEAGVEKSKINQKIMIIEKTENDKKFVEWLKEQMPNFVDGISFEEETKKEEKIDNFNPFINETIESSENNTPSEKVKEDEIAVSQNDKGEDNQDSYNKQEDAEEKKINSEIEPSPVQNTPLETKEVNVANQILEPSPMPPVKDEVPEVSEQPEVVSHKRSGGFVNLLILVVILVVVTIVSIELGKFLYTTYGA